MNLSPLAVILPVCLGFPIASALPDDAGYTVGLEQARKAGERDGAKYHAEFGDTDGPFRWVASARTGSTAFPGFRVRFGEGPVVHWPEIRDPEISFEVDFYTNARGNGLGIVYRTPTSGDHLPEDEPEDPRPPTHRALSGAAEHALLGGDRELMAALLEAGLDVNLSLDPEFGNVPLQSAALFGDVEMVEFLLARGADPKVRNTFGDRAIDCAVDKGHDAIGELLRVESDDEGEIAGFPRGLVEESFLKEAAPKGLVFFVSLNGGDADGPLLDLFRSRWPESEIHPRSAMIEGASGTVGTTEITSVYRNRETGEPGILLELTLEKDGEVGFRWKKREATGPALSGGGVEGTTTRQFGYWIATTTSSWDE